MALDASELNFFVQYRGKRNAVFWRTMAAFDTQGPAEWYFGMQKSEVWDYRLVDAYGAAVVTAGEGNPK